MNIFLPHVFSQNWGSDNHFDVLNKPRFWLVQKLWHKMQIHISISVFLRFFQSELRNQTNLFLLNIDQQYSIDFFWNNLYLQGNIDAVIEMTKLSPFYINQCIVEMKTSLTFQNSNNFLNWTPWFQNILKNFSNTYSVILLFRFFDCIQKAKNH